MLFAHLCYALCTLMLCSFHINTMLYACMPVHSLICSAHVTLADNRSSYLNAMHHDTMVHLYYTYMWCTAGVGIQINFSEVISTGQQSLISVHTAAIYISTISSSRPHTWTQKQRNTCIMSIYMYYLSGYNKMYFLNTLLATLSFLQKNVFH